MFPKLLCIICGFAALALSGVFMATYRFSALLGSFGCFIAFQILFWKYLRQK